MLVTLNSSGGLGIAGPIEQLVNMFKTDALTIISVVISTIAIVIAGFCFAKAIMAWKGGNTGEVGKWVMYAIGAMAIAGIFGLVQKFGNKIGSNVNKVNLNQLGIMIPAYYAYMKAKHKYKLNK